MQVLPFFSLIMAIIAALGDVTSGWLLPALFVLKLSTSGGGGGNQDSRVGALPRWQAMICYVLVPLAAVLSVAGLASSVAALVSKLLGHS